MKLSAQQHHTLACYISECGRAGWRAIVHIQGSYDYNHACVEQIEPLLRGSIARLDYNGHLLSVQALQQLLGTELDVLIVDAWTGFNPNAVGIATACIRAGGVLLILSPAAEDWPFYQDPDYQRMLGAADPPLVMPARFLGRCARHLASSKTIARLYESGDFFVPPVPNRHFIADFSGQAEAVIRIKRVATGHGRRPLVLSADRGRGKSAALGIACAELMQEKTLDIVVTAVSSQAVLTLFAHLTERLGQLTRGPACYQHQDSRIRFMPMDQLLEETPSLDLLVIDEAAALPVALLQSCVRRYNRLVFSTTVDGYEGNGRGFSLRFLAQLQTMMPQYQQWQLKYPIRYAADDPLEALSHHLLLLKQPPQETAIPASPPVFRQLHRDELVQDELLLQQCFGLLIQAHYQTSPDDLRLMLDHPLVRIVLAQADGKLLAVALIMEEGDFDTDWQQAIKKGRRPAGHLMPRMMHDAGFDSALAMSCCRVMRIAVQPALQRQGIGRRLIDFTYKHFSCDFVGAAFSAEAGIVRFWQACGMQVIHIGSHRESGTGQYACLVVRACSEQAQQLQKQMRQALAQDIACRLSLLNCHLQAPTVWAVLHDLPLTVSTRDANQVMAYASGQLGFEQVLPGLQRFLLACAAQGVQPQHYELLFDRILLNHHWQEAAQNYKLAGRKIIEKSIRQALMAVIDQVTRQEL